MQSEQLTSWKGFKFSFVPFAMKRKEGELWLPEYFEYLTVISPIKFIWNLNRFQHSAHVTVSFVMFFKMDSSLVFYTVILAKTS